ncbi:SIR2 family protein [Brachyspira murdochii]|uniref:SIR2 family protein n=1 Tax=Brachyspira murdochii TaxID=84378 RepID=UPI0012F521F9|nr:SIR2 family protein [Brachyspira murdochii]
MKDLEFIKKAFESGNINFLIGAGASMPAIQALGNLENELEDLIANGEKDKVNEKLNNFIRNIITPNIKIFTINNIEEDKNNENNEKEKKDLIETISNYDNFIKSLIKILLKRKNDLILPNINIFTTNYDLFLENSCENIIKEPDVHCNYNDGFMYKNSMFHDSIFDISEYYKMVSYKSKIDYSTSYIPNINIIKLHGSVNWKIRQIDNETNIIYNDINNYNNDDENLSSKIGIVLPTNDKYSDTVLKKAYYTALRFLSSELEKENSILFAFGFSFRDEHLNDIIKQVLKTNPSLQLIISSFNSEAYKTIKQKFSNYINVKYLNEEILKDNGNKNTFGFNKINEILKNI